MEEFFTKTRIKNLIIAAAIVILGIVFCAMNNQATQLFEVLGYICGGLLMAVGVLLIVMYFVNYKKETSAKNFIYGGLAFVFGLIMVISGQFFIATLMVLAVGFFMCALGIIYMSKGFEKLRVGNKNIWKELTYGIVSFVLGIVLLILLMVAPNAVVIFMGIALILVGICLCLLVALGDKVTVSVKKQIEKEDKKEETAKETAKAKKTTKKSGK